MRACGVPVWPELHFDGRSAVSVPVSHIADSKNHEEQGIQVWGSCHLVWFWSCSEWVLVQRARTVGWQYFHHNEPTTGLFFVL